MRWLLVVLVVVNTLFCLYHLSRENIEIVAEQNQSASSEKGELRLLSEAKPLQSRKPIDAVDATCFFIGGFDNEADALAVEQRLVSLDIDAALEQQDEAAGVDYWVYLPPLVSRQASVRQLSELQSRNIDSYIITVGDLANGISLGIFSRKDSAESVLSRLQSIGYSPSLRELPRVHRTYWVRLPPSAEQLVGEAPLSEIKRSFPAIAQQQKPCGGIATPH